MPKIPYGDKAFKEWLEEQRSRPEPITFGPLELRVGHKNGDYWDVGVYFGEDCGLFDSRNANRYMGKLHMPKSMWLVLEKHAVEASDEDPN